MEMEEISKEPEATAGYEEPSAGARRSKSEEEADEYSKLHNPSEDVYAEAQFPLSKKKDGEALPLRLWKGVSAILGLICLILILIVVVLAMRLQDTTPAVSCPPAPASGSPCQCSTVLFNPCPASQCAPGWVQHGESCYFLSAVRSTWDDARRNCTEMKADLAVIRTPSVQKFLTQSEPPLKYWIGLNYKRSWIWVDDQSMTVKYSIKL